MKHTLTQRIEGTLTLASLETIRTSALDEGAPTDARVTIKSGAARDTYITSVSVEWEISPAVEEEVPAGADD